MFPSARAASVHVAPTASATRPPRPGDKPQQPTHRWSLHDDHQIVQLLRAGQTVPQVARQFDWSALALGGYIRRRFGNVGRIRSGEPLGLPALDRPWEPPDPETVADALDRLRVALPPDTWTARDRVRLRNALHALAEQIAPSAGDYLDTAPYRR